MGFESAPRQTTADFLTSLTSPAERIVKSGFEDKTPRTAAEFAAAWKRSREYATLVRDIEVYEETYPIGGQSRAQREPNKYVAYLVLPLPLPLLYITLAFWLENTNSKSHRRMQSPYTLSFYQQVMLCVGRGFQRLKGDASVTISRIVGNTILALVVGMKEIMKIPRIQVTNGNCRIGVL